MPRGRPRTFDPDEALDEALKVFWRKGYEGASLPELTRAMGINRPSLYAAFGNKEQLFSKAMERYTSGPAAYVRRALDAPTARQVFERVLEGALCVLSDRRNPRGCLAVQGALVCGDAADSVRRQLVQIRESGVAALRKRFQKAKTQGDLPRDSSPGDLARYVATVMHGLSVQAASGASRGELERVGKLALRAWPTRR